MEWLSDILIRDYLSGAKIWHKSPNPNTANHEAIFDEAASAVEVAEFGGEPPRESAGP
jgi:hypothetical protein